MGTRIAAGVSIVALAGLAGCNQSPLALDDEISTARGAAVHVPVLDNDSDPDGDPVVLADAWGAEKGTVEVTADNRVLYIPSEGELGQDLFEYRVKDNEGKDSTARVLVNIEPYGDVLTAGDVPPVGAFVDNLLLTFRTMDDDKNIEEPVRILVRRGGETVVNQLVGVNELWPAGSTETFEIDLVPDVPLSEIGALTVDVQKLPAEGAAGASWVVEPQVAAELANGRIVALSPQTGALKFGDGEPFERTLRIGGVAE